MMMDMDVSTNASIVDFIYFFNDFCCSVSYFDSAEVRNSTESNTSHYSEMHNVVLA